MDSELSAWALIGAGFLLGILAIALSKWMPSKPVHVMAPGKLGDALATLRAPVELPDGRVVKFQVRAVFEKPRSAA